jgi:hypothetical protein
VEVLQLRFGVVRVWHMLLILHVRSGEQVELRKGATTSGARVRARRDGEKGQGGLPGSFYRCMVTGGH